MGPVVDVRIKSLDAKILVFHTEFEVMAVEHNSLAK